MFSEDLFVVDRPIREDLALQYVSLPSCGKCPLRKADRCDYRGSPAFPVIPAGYNGVLILYSQKITGETLSALLYHIQSTGADPDKCCFMPVTQGDLDLTDHSADFCRVAADCCRPLLYKTLLPLIGKTKVILVVGYDAFYALYGARVQDGRTIAPSGKDSEDSAGKWRGWRIPDGLLQAYVCPLYGLSVLRESTEKSAARLLFKQDILSAMQTVTKRQPKQLDYEKCLVYDKDLSYFRQLVDDVLMELPAETMLAVDYETTGLKPHATGHKIACLSFCWDGRTSYAFKLDSEKAKQLAVDIMSSPHRKIAANMKFEEAWTRRILGVSVNNWYWDTMLMAHILDNRDSISGVKFQSFVRFGLCDYNSHVKAALESAKDSNGINDVMSISNHDLLKYCAMDSLVEYRIAVQQMRELGERGT